MNPPQFIHPTEPEFQVVQLQNIDLPVDLGKNDQIRDLAIKMKKSQIAPIEALEMGSTRKMQDFDHLKKNTMFPTQTVLTEKSFPFLSSTAGLTKLSGIDIYN